MNSRLSIRWILNLCRLSRTQINKYISLLDSTGHAFKYAAFLDEDKLIFRGRDGGDDICIKFVRRYSKDAHLKCASLGFAPTLRGFQSIPGEWYMVIMDYIDDT